MSTLALDGVRPRSRSTDPTTSVDAGRCADLTASQREVLALFEVEDRPLADHELVAAAQSWGSPFTPQRIRSARAELAEDGRLALVEDEYRATATGHKARVWRTA